MAIYIKLDMAILGVTVIHDPNSLCWSAEIDYTAPQPKSTSFIWS